MEARKASFAAPYAVSVGLLPTPGGRRASSGRMDAPLRADRHAQVQQRRELVAEEPDRGEPVAGLALGAVGTRRRALARLEVELDALDRGAARQRVEDGSDGQMSRKR